MLCLRFALNFAEFHCNNHSKSAILPSNVPIYTRKNAEKRENAKNGIVKMVIRAMSNFHSQRKQKPLDEASLEKKNDPLGIVVLDHNGGGVGI